MRARGITDVDYSRVRSLVSDVHPVCLIQHRHPRACAWWSFSPLIARLTSVIQSGGSVKGANPSLTYSPLIAYLAPDRYSSLQREIPPNAA